MGFKDEVVGIRVKEEEQEDQFICLKCVKFPEIATKENAVTVPELMYTGQAATCDRCGRIFERDNDYIGFEKEE